MCIAHWRTYYTFAIMAKWPVLAMQHTRRHSSKRNSQKKKMWKTVPASLFCVLMHLNVADCRRMQISSASRQINWPALQSVWLAAKYWCASLLAYANYIYKAHLPVHTVIGFTRMIGASQRTWLTFIIINIRHRVRMECVYTWAQVTHLNQI